MYTVFTKEIDGLTVVLGIDKERIDQMATMKKIKPLIESTKEFKAKKGRLDKIQSLSTSNDSLNRQAKTVLNRASLRCGVPITELTDKSLTASETESINKYGVHRGNNNDEIKNIQEELPAVEEKLKTVVTGIMKKNAVYFNLKSDGENAIEETKALVLKKALSGLKKGEFLLADGTIQADFRNKTFYGKISGVWDKVECKLLSDTVDLGLYKLMEDLTDEERQEMAIQFEADRISGLSEEDKSAELQMVKDNLVSQAVAMRNKLEIQGDREALVKSQEWYKAELVIAEEKYK